MKSIDHFQGDCRLYVWLCSIAKNLWYREMRKKEREYPSCFEDEILPAETDTENSAIQRVQVIELYKILHSFEEPLREVMYLRLNGNFTFREIGDIMGRDENWARVTFYRGRQRIRKESRYEM